MPVTIFLVILLNQNKKNFNKNRLNKKAVTTTMLAAQCWAALNFNVARTGNIAYW